GVVGSAVGMDKGVFKHVMRARGIPVVDWLVVTRREIETQLDEVVRRAEALSDYPIFTKPANLGSSVGVRRCKNRAELIQGLGEAARYDRRILIEHGIPQAREIEVSILGNEEPQASIAGEIIPSREFYSYEAKYLDGTSGLLIPAPISAEQMALVQRLALEAYRAVDCAGMARVDFLMDRQKEAIYLNEINTIPGFTSISMYPKLWEASGLTYPQLVDRLIELALERQAERQRTERVYRR
ncbi:MAG: D-alanine--D-alanine ligase family protein, partial [Anaerolineales bacterium]